MQTMTNSEIQSASQSALRTYVRQLKNSGQLVISSPEWAAIFPEWINGRVAGYTIADTRMVAAQRRFPLDGWQLPKVGGETPKADTKPAPMPVAKPAVATASDAPAVSGVSREDMLRHLLNGVSRDDCVAICNEIVTARIPEHLPETKIILRDGQPPKKLKGTFYHNKFDTICKLANARRHVYGYGPSGTGKTELGQQVAKAIDLPFYFSSKITAEHHFLGFIDGGGKYHKTAFFKAFTAGGLFLFDELDGSNPNVVLRLNSSLANGFCDFPTGNFKAHPDFVCFGAGNTKLDGADREYNTRSQQDSAVRDRFRLLEIGYDNKLETGVASAQYNNGAAVAKRVQSIREAVKALKIRHTVTMRATFGICEDTAIGFSMADAEGLNLWKGLDQATVNKIEAQAKSAAA